VTNPESAYSFSISEYLRCLFADIPWIIPVICLTLIFFAAQPWSFGLAKHTGELLCLYSLFLTVKEYRHVRFNRVEKTAIISGLLFFFWLCVSYWTSDYDSASVDNYLVFLFIAPLIYSYRGAFRTYDQIAVVLFLVSVSYLVYAIHMYKTGFAVRWSGDENAVNFGNSMILFGIASIFLLPFLRFNTVRVLVIAAGCIFMLCAYKSGTRGNILGLIAVCLVTLFICIRGTATVRKISIAIIFFLVALPLLNWQKVNLTYQNTVDYFSGQNIASSAGQRLVLWRYSSCLVTKYPITGVGPGAFKSAQQSQDCMQARKMLWPYFQSHSVYFHTMATAGIPGMIALLAFFISIIVMSYRVYGYKAIPVIATIAAMMGYGLTVDLYFMKVLAMRHVISIILILACLHHYRDQATNKNSQSTVIPNP